MTEENRFDIDGSLDPSQEKRKRRMIAVMNLIRIEGEVEKRILCGQLSVLSGIRRSTVEEYLRDLEDFGVIEIAGDTIRWIGEDPEEEG